MDGAEAAKRAAGERAASLVEDGMTLGLGTGSTARWFIAAVGRLVADGMRLRGVPTSAASAALAGAAGIPLAELDEAGLDLAVDGADAVDPDLRLIKGAGGAMLREKVVAAAARSFVVVVDASKLTPRLCGRLPVEIVPFGFRATLAAVSAATAVDPVVRRTSAGETYVTDNGNLVADCGLDAIEDPEGLAERLDALPGVAGHGLFLGMTDVVIAARGDGSVEEIRAPG